LHTLSIAFPKKWKKVLLFGRELTLAVKLSNLNQNHFPMNIQKKIAAVVIGIAMLSGFGGCVQRETKELIIVGTFDGGGSEGLYVFSFDRENLGFELLQTISDRLAPSFQAVHPKMPVVYSASRSPISADSEHQTIGAYRVDKITGTLSLINEQSAMGTSPAHVSVDPLGSFVYVSNYTSGNVSMYPIRDDGGLDAASDVVQHLGSSINPSRQQNAHAHAADPSPDGSFVYVSDLGMDKIMIYEVDRQQKKLSPASTPWFENTPGAGPRHMSFRPDGAYAYSAEELTSTIAVLRVDKNTGALQQVQRVSMLPDDFDGSNTAADIHVSPDGKFLYASNRGHDSIVIFAIDESSGELSLAGHESAIGQHPRNFMIDKSGELVFVANRDSNHMVVFRRDPATGSLNYTNTELIVPLAVCVTQMVVK
jgi:6-phosphogluconolactonase